MKKSVDRKGGHGYNKFVRWATQMKSERKTRHGEVSKWS